MHLSAVLQQLGYKKNEARVYLAALSMGESTIADIASRLKIPRSSVKIIVDTLHKQGMMDVYAKKKYRYWVAENPERLMIAIKEKEAALKEIMPELATFRTTGGAKPTVRFYNGVEEILLISDDIIATKKDLYAIIPLERWYKTIGEERVKSAAERRRRAFIATRILTVENDVSKNLREISKDELRIVRFLVDKVDQNTCVFIYGNKVGIVSLNSWQPMAIVIEDASIRNLHFALLIFCGKTVFKTTQQQNCCFIKLSLICFQNYKAKKAIYNNNFL